MAKCGFVGVLSQIALVFAAAGSAMLLPAQRLEEIAYVPDPGCAAGQAWNVQTDARSDVSGKNNINFPLQQATYWGTPLTGSDREVATIKGRFPAARYMSFQVYNYTRNVLSSIADVDIDPDPGQTNPYRPGNGNAQGTYTLRLVFGRQLVRTPPRNTLHAGADEKVILLYRIYYANNPNDVTAGTSNPILPTVIREGVPMITCPPRSVDILRTSTVWGRLEGNNFVGVRPAVHFPAINPPIWSFSTTDGGSRFFPNQDNSYMTALLSRAYLAPPFRNDLVVMRMRAPSWTDTQSGVPPYAPADARMWSVCTNEPLSTGVVRCISDNQATIVNGFATFVISDPAKKPAADVLRQWGATWLPWGALAPGDSVYNARGSLLTKADGVNFYGYVMYRQTGANASFAASIANLSGKPRDEAQRLMGDYWPQIGYCSLANFQVYGPDCPRR